MPPDEAFGFFADAHNLEAITPPWLGFEITTRGTIDMNAGTLISYRLRLHGLPVIWHTKIVAWDPGRRFVDTQLDGPYRLWHHTHDFEPVGTDETLMRDTVRYVLPLGALGDLAHALLVRRDLDRIFAFRRSAVAERMRP